MNISRITFLSQFVEPLLVKTKPVIKKENEYSKVTGVTSKGNSDNNTRHFDTGHDPMYYYNLAKENNNKLI